MKRTFLLAAVSVAPFLCLAAGQAFALDSITGSTSTPVATATATSGAPDDIDISSTGSLGVTAPGTAVTLNSSNVVTVEGAIGFTAIDHAVGIAVEGGNTGSVTNSGSITVTDGYTATTNPNTGLLEVPFATGNNRIGIEVVAGSGTFSGFIANYGSITVHGDNSYGVDIAAPMTEGYRSLQYTAATSTTDATLLSGSITVIGGEPALGTAAATYPVTGFYVAPTGSLGGNVTLGYVSATGYGAKAVDIEGNVSGAVDFAGAVTSTGYESTTRSSYPTIAVQYTALEMLQGGSAVTIGANVGTGILISAPPLTAITDASTASDIISGVSVPQTLEATGSISTYGSAPALVIGSAVRSVTVGTVDPTLNTIQGVDAATSAYGLVNEGTITGDGVFDKVNYPNLPARVSATAIQIGSTGGFAATIQGGIYNTGAIEGLAYQADATGIHFLSGGSTPLILNDGSILASSIQENTSTTVPPVSVAAILIENGATVTNITNNGGITANITGESGPGGTVGAIIDRSTAATPMTITNTGTISAQSTQTLITALMPVTATAIDLSAGAGAQTITQKLSSNSLVSGSAAYNDTISYSQGAIVNYNGIVYQATTAAGVDIDPYDYPSYWRQIGATSPYINGSIYMGSGGSTLNIYAGTVTGPIINLGTGTNTVTVGTSTSSASVSGAIEELTGAVTSLGTTDNLGTLTLNVVNGTLSDTNPNTVYAKSVNVGASGILLVSADPVNNLHTEFFTSGASTFAQGAQIGLTLLSIPKTLQETYTILQTTGAGTITAGKFGTSQVESAPWLYNAVATYVPATTAGGPSEIELTVSQKTAAQIGFNAAEASALDAVLAAAPNNVGIQDALLSQTTESGLKSVYDQLLPNQQQGLFDSLDAAAQAIGSMTGTAPEAASRVAGTSLWLQQVNERVDRSGAQSDGSYSKLFGLVGGYEHMGSGGGAVGLTLAYINASELPDAAQLGTGVVASMVQAGIYYRRTMGRFSMSAQAGVGYSWFAEDRVFATSTDVDNTLKGTELTAHANWGGVFYDGHVQVAYEQPLGRFYVRPEISADYLELNEDSYSETGGGKAFDLNVAAQDSNRLSGQAIMVVGRQWGQATWLRFEVRGGFREIFAGNVGDTVASFNGGNPFTLAPDDDKGGWVTAGFSIKGGSEYSYLALEGDVDYRAGEQEYDLRIAGRSIF